ncbi:alkaline phosphatase family protein, partial [Sphingomonas sp. ABOLH]|uniref:alkaline phosphatase family protein n=1 Tax=Sphingomonas sp. ABOLH TaxID=1985881 RepID=UPI0010026715
MRFLTLAALLLGTAVPALAQTAAPAPVPAALPVPPTYPATPPKLIVAISVDQFSADLFAEYRARFTGGFVRMMQGAVFPSGYQSHAATETCPGHSTILTGSRPSRTGIIANDWIDQRGNNRPDHKVYCAEDERVPGSTFKDYTVSDVHLMVPTLGERMKAADPRTRVVSVAGKDRAAVMMGGHKVDELWWFGKDGFTSYAGRTMPPVVARANAAVAKQIATAQGPMPLRTFCQPLARAVAAARSAIGTGRFVRAAGDVSILCRSHA